MPQNRRESSQELSRELFELSQQYIPGGVNSPVRAFRAVGGVPPFIVRGRGAHVFDADGHEYIDYVGAYGPLILGHAHPKIVEVVSEAARRGTAYGAPTPQELELARMIVEAVPSVEMVRLVNSGTEATMSALRLARAYTGRNKIIKFEGCYHGHADGLLVQAGSGVATFGLPDSPGVPPSYTQETLVAPYNDLPAVERLFQEHGSDIAAVIIEPVAANMGVVTPAAGFLEGLRELTRSAGALLIFDEIITGFRLAYGGAQSVFNVAPDLTCLGKVIGGGLPVGAYGGRQDIMQMVAPSGPVYQAGTLSGNPLAVAAGIATLKLLADGNAYARLDEISAALEQGLREAAARAEVPVRINRVGSIMTAFFATDEVHDFTSAKRSDTGMYARFFHAMLKRGVYLAPSQFEAMFISLAHTDADIEVTVRNAADALMEATRG